MIKKNRFWQLLLILFLISFSVICPFADDGEGEGGGQNQDEPLTLVSSNLRDGQKGVGVGAAIDLEFSKNVVNMAVAENNRNSISLTDREGNSVPIEVRMGDDQVDPTIKRMITIVPKDPLTPETVYTLTISGGFQSKSGTALGTPIIISFQTAGSDNGSTDGEKEGNDMAPATQNTTTDPGLSTESTDYSKVPSEQSEKSQVPTDNEVSPWLIFSTVCFFAAAALLVTYAVRRIKK